MKKKLLALLLAAAMVFEGTGILQVQAAITSTDKDNTIVLELDEEYDVSLLEGESKYYKFVPEETGWYEFVSYNSGGESTYVDTYVELYDSEGEETIAADDDSKGNGHFKLKYKLESGVTYYFKTNCYGEVAGEYGVVLKKSIFYAVASEQNVTVKYGESSCLNVDAGSERGNLTYQWYKDWIDEENKIENATGNSYAVEGIKENNSSSYYCVVSDGTEEVNVNFYVIVDTGLKLVEEYVNVTVEYGSSTTVTVGATSAVDELSYEWYYWKYYEDAEDERIVIPEETGASLEIEGRVDTPDTYYCTISDGINTITCTINVTIDTGLEIVNNDEFITIDYNPEDTTTIEVVANSAITNLKYRWYYVDEEGNQIDIDEDSSILEIVTDSSVKSMYCCEVSDGIQSDIFCVYVTLDTGLELVETDININLEYGGSETITVKATGGAGDYTYQWYTFDEDDNAEIIQGETSATFTIEGNKQTKQKYWCQVSDGVSIVEFYVYVELDTGLEIEDEYQYVKVEYGENKVLSAVATGGLGELRYQWYYYKEYEDEYGNICNDYFKINGASKSTCTVSGNKDISNVYMCEISDGIITKNAYVYVTLDTGLEIDDEYQYVTVEYGKNKVLSVIATGGKRELSYQWYYYGYEEDEWGDIYGKYVKIDGATKNTYTILGNKDISNEYMCEISDGIITKNAYVYVTLDTRLRVENIEKYLNLAYGTDNVLYANATGGVGELSYQWYYEVTYEDEYGNLWSEYQKIDGATKETYNISANDEVYKKYRCEITDGIDEKFCCFYITWDTGLDINNEDFYINIVEGKTKELTVDATGGVGELSYQWYCYDKNYYNENDDSNYRPIEGANNPSYQITADETMYTEYRCVVSDSIISKEVYYYVYKIEPIEFSLTENLLTESEAYYEIKGLNGSYELYMQDTDYSQRLILYNEEMDVVINTYSDRFTYVFEQDKTYYLMVYSAAVENLNTPVGIYCKDVEFAAVRKGDYSNVVKYGSDCTMEVIASYKEGEIKYEWYGIDDDGYHLIADECQSTYTFRVDEKIYRNYCCKVTNSIKCSEFNAIELETIEVEFYIDIDTGLVASISPSMYVKVPYGGTTTIKVNASTDLERDITYQWYYWDSETYQDIKITGATDSRYELKGDDKLVESYYCRISDGINTIYSENFYTTLDSGLIIFGYDDGLSMNIDYGELVELEVVATSKTPNITYEWYYWDSYYGEYKKLGKNTSKYTYIAQELSPTDILCRVSDGITSLDKSFYINYYGTITDISEEYSATLKYNSVVEDGTAKIPEVTVNNGNKVLIKDTHYTVEYKNNVKAGTATVVIKGIGKYTGTITKTFTITAKPTPKPTPKPTQPTKPTQPVVVKPKVTSISNAKITLAKKSYTYDGSAKKPAVSVVVGGKTLVNGKDYTVAYSNNKNIGKSTVTVTGKGSYNGSVKTTFNININLGKVYTVGAYKYKVTSNTEVAFAGLKKATTKKVVISGTVKIGGKKFKITSIADKALQKKTKVTSVTVGENVKKIGKNAFNGCKNIKTITVKSTKIKSVGKDALKGINSKAKIKVPSKSLKTYKKVFKGKGQGKKVKITK